MAASDLPIGAILPYAGAGELTAMQNDLEQKGWFICNGSVAHYKQCEDLYALLHPLDKDPPATFNLPNFEGMFLRGYDPDGRTDKGLPDRYDPVTKAASFAVGSKQDYATANSSGGFRTPPLDGPVGTVPAWDRFWTNETIVRGGSCNVPLAGRSSDDPRLEFPQETRPKNIYVLYIIKFLEGAEPPVGTVAQFLVTPPAGIGGTYLRCDGQAPPDGDYSDLGTCLAKAYGMAGANFKLPNYLGLFFRGLDLGLGYDPDWASRASAAIPARKGNTNGTTQRFDTGPPKKPMWLQIPLAVDTPDLPLPDKVDSPARAPASSGTAAAYTDTNSIVAATAAGGDLETRPANCSVDSYVQAKALLGDAPGLPVGALIAWLADDISMAGPNFAECNGTNGAPDLSGRFLRNMDGGSGRDPDCAKRTLGTQKGDLVGSYQDEATADGSTSLAIKWPLPTATYAVDNEGGGSVNAAGFGATSYPLIGGDPETRPVNISVKFLIRTK